jgi:hypothetical protein
MFSVIFCVCCGEVFTLENDAWLHLLDHHTLIEQDAAAPEAKFSSLRSLLPLYKKSEEPPAKKIKLDPDASSAKDEIESIIIRVPSRELCSNDFIRMIYVTKLYHCEYCDALFANHNTLLSHTSTHEPSSYFSCCFCNLSGFSFKDILLHRLLECMIYRDHRNMIKDIPGRWYCNVCEDEFLGVEQLVQHR